MISPYQTELNNQGVISSGTSSYGYDARLDRHLKFSPTSILLILIQRTLMKKLLFLEADVVLFRQIHLLWQNCGKIQNPSQCRHDMP